MPESISRVDGCSDDGDDRSDGDGSPPAALPDQHRDGKLASAASGDEDLIELDAGDEGRPRFTRITDHRFVGLVATCTGFVLAVVGLTLPWAQMTPVEAVAQHLTVPTYLTEYRAATAPLAALALVTVVFTAVFGFISGGQGAWLIQTYAAWASTIVLVSMLAGTMYGFRGARVAIVDPTTAKPLMVTAQTVVPTTGAVLYAAGLALPALASCVAALITRLGAAESNGDRARTATGKRRRRLSWAASFLALVLAVTSLVLPWYHQGPGLDGSNELAPGTVTVADIQAWLALYRAGLVISLLLYLAMVVTTRAMPLRTAGIVTATAVWALLLIGFVASWWRTPLESKSAFLEGGSKLDLGAGFVVAWLAITFVLISFALMAPASGRPDQARQPTEVRRHEETL
jgi:hypothetical protein